MSSNPSRDASIWDKENVPLTVGSILAISLGALQGLAVATIAPVVATDLDGHSLYGWIFTAFLIPQIVGTVIAGQEIDRRKPATVFYTAMAIFGLGSIIAGAAPDIWTLFAGRALQGFGTGAMFATIYAIVSGAYDDRLRPAMLAALSSAWIVPSLLGPVISGVVADLVTWRYVFWGLVPLIGVITPLTWPTYRAVTLEQDETAQVNARRVPYAIVLAVGAGLFLAGPDVHPVWFGALLTVVGVVMLMATLGRLLPPGTFTARPMLGAAIANRALVFGGFIVTETYMVYALKEVGEVSTSTAGAVITVGSLTWTTGAILQARMDREHGAGGRNGRVRAGTALMVTGVSVIFGMVAVFGETWLIAIVAAWLLTGLGMGLAYTTSTAIAFAAAPRGQDGMVSSSTLLGDLFSSAVGVGIGGILLTAGDLTGLSTVGSTALALAFGLALLGTGAVAALRLGRDQRLDATERSARLPQAGE